MPTNLEGEGTLYSLAYDCEGLFDQLQKVFQKTKFEVATIEVCADLQQRFAIWAAHLGVFARKSQCLDTRLEIHPDLHDLVARLLDILRRSLQQYTIETSSQGEVDMATIGFNEFPHRAPQIQTDILKTIDNTLTRLNRLGVTIRQSGHGKLDTRAKKFVAGLDLSSFAYLCANAVQTLYPGAHQSLKDYLSKSMTDRYARMLFSESRRKNLMTRRELRIGLPPIDEVPGSETQLPNDEVPDSETKTSIAITQLAMPIKNPIVTNLSQLPPALSQSDLSSVNVHQIRSRTRPPDEASIKFHKTSSIQVNQGNYPRPFVINQGSSIFTCQWCSEPLNKKTLSESEWRRHIDRDLKPYICLSERCPEAHPAYPTFNEWFRHMELHDWRWHQRVYLMSSWVCTICEFNRDVYSSQQALYSHLEESHSSGFTNAQLQAISRQSKTEQPRASNNCPLCCFMVEEQGYNGEAVFPKRRKGQPKQEASKSVGKVFKMANPDPHSSDLEPSDTSSDSEDMGSHQKRKRRNRDSSKAVTRHIAVHLQVLMLLTLRFAAALQDDDEDLGDSVKSDSVSIDEGNSALEGTDLGRLSDIDFKADITLEDIDDEDNVGDAMDPDNAVEDSIPIPDTDLNLKDIPGQYDGLAAENDAFLKKVIESGAYQSWRDPPKLRGTGRRFATERDLVRLLQRSMREDEERKELELRKLGLQIQQEKNRSDKEAVIPDMCWDNLEKQQVYDRSGYTPPDRLVSAWHILPPINNFTEEEAQLFEKRYLELPKQWGKIAEVLPTRDFHSCIQYYYLMKGELNLKEKIKKQPKRRKKSMLARQRSSALVSDLSNGEPEAEEIPQENGENGERRRPRRAAAPTWGFEQPMTDGEPKAEEMLQENGENRERRRPRRAAAPTWGFEQPTTDGESTSSV
ncbi:hypothetical protein MKX08_000172 [Trichoderma sp. CBMAI-0020]|nr:hypothetical protein MKX08_000172 [Trichoderma sp. CBMAI-0020]